MVLASYISFPKLSFKTNERLVQMNALPAGPLNLMNDPPFFWGNMVCSGITRGRVLNGELYVPGIYKFIFLHLCTELF